MNERINVENDTTLLTVVKQISRGIKLDYINVVFWIEVFLWWGIEALRNMDQ